MTVILELAPEYEARLKHRAEQEGQDVGSYLLSLAKREEQAEAARVQTQREKNQAAIDMLNEWAKEDQTDDPEEIARRQAEWEEFKEGMNAAHTSDRIIYP